MRKYPTSFKSTFLGVFLIFLMTSALAQDEPAKSDTANFPYYFDMMQDPDVNFYSAQNAFYQYWEDRKIEKGSGYKPFKRWEAIMSTRVDDEGNKPSPDRELKAVQKMQASGILSTSSGNWIELGPRLLPIRNTPWSQANGLGRVNCIAFDALDSNLIYIGAPAGGFWSSKDAGKTWASNTDTLPTLGVSSIAVSPANGNVIYLGSGDRDSNDSPGLGVLKSTDGGNSWIFANSGMGNVTVGAMVIHPWSDNIILAATSGGIYLTVDSANTWQRVSTNSNFYKDIEFHPTNPSIVYATEGGNFYKSTNSGNNWSQITSGFSSSGINRMVLAVTKANSNVVYVLASSGSVYEGLYKSTNSGSNFSLRSSTPNLMDYSFDGSGSRGQANYDLCLAVSPVNENVVLAGGVNIFKSTDGGQNWLISGHWTGGSSNGNSPRVHADEHALEYSPHSNQLFAGNDGGIYRSRDHGITYQDISSGLAIAQAYRLGLSAQSRDLLVCGYQDNGTGMMKQSQWSTILGADGMEAVIDYLDSNFVYCTTQNGNVYRSDSYGSNASRISSSTGESGLWITQFALDVKTPDVMYLGQTNFWRTENVKTSSTSSINWTNLTQFANPSGKVSRFNQSQANPDVMYFATSAGEFYRSDNITHISPSFTSIQSNLPSSSNVIDVEAHPSNDSLVYIILGTRVLKSADRGITWANITSNLPLTSYNNIAIDRRAAEGIYLASDIGVFYKDSTMLNWQFFGDGIPLSIKIHELEIYYHPTNHSESRIRAATYGRGIWESDLYTIPTIGPIANFALDDTLGCVGFPISLFDLSQNVPRKWKWEINPNTFTFINGTSDTSFNPQLSFNQKGTYNIKLIAYNIYGADSITKNAVIRIIDKWPMPFTEDFEGNISLKQTRGDDIEWTLNSGTTPSSSTGPSSDHTSGGTYYMYTEASGSNNNSVAILETYCFNLSSTRDPYLSFWYHMYGLNMGDLKVEIDTGYNNWLSLWSESGDKGNIWLQDSIDLKPYKNQSFRLRFWRKTGSDYRSDMAIDDIQLKDNGKFEDLAVVTIENNSRCGARPTEEIEIEIENKGLSSQSNFNLVYSINSGTSIKENFTGTLLAGASTIYIFKAKANLAPTQSYQIKAWVESNLNDDPTNDTIVKQIDIWALPTVRVNPRVSSINRLDSATIIASGADRYNWQYSAFLTDTSKASVKAFPQVTDTFYVTGWDLNNCWDTDSAVVIVGNVGIEDLKDTFIKLVPNPGRDLVAVIYNTKNVSLVNLELRDYLGKLIYKMDALEPKGNFILDLSTISPGMYFVQLRSKTEILKSSKLLKY